MAIDLSPIATAAEYRAYNGIAGTGATADDTRITTLLTSCTRLLESRLGVAPGMLLPQTSLAFSFSGDDTSRLDLRDEQERMYFLRSITADSLKIDSDGDGDYDYTYDSADAWVRLRPINAATFNDPYTHIELVSTVTGAGLYTFPKYAGNVQITGNWGLSATSSAIGILKARVIQIVREISDSINAGAALNVTFVEEAIGHRPTSAALMIACEREFSYRMPVIR